MEAARVNHTEESLRRWVFGPPQMCMGEYQYWVVHLSRDDLDQTYLRMTTGSTVPREDFEELCMVPLEQAVYGTAWTLILVDGPGEYPEPRWKTHAQWMLISMEKNSSVALSFMKHTEYLTGSIWRPLPDGTWTVFYLSPNELSAAWSTRARLGGPDRIE